MRYIVTLALFVAATSLSARAQQLDIPVDRALRSRSMESARKGGDVTRLHVTDSLLNSAQGRAALAQFQANKAAGKASIPTAHKSYTPGQTHTFKVANQSTHQYENIQFRLVVIAARDFNIWLEVGQAADEGGYITLDDIQRISNGLLSNTPPDSYNPQQGVIENDEEVFGSPPDRDGDGRTDILLLDIRDNYNPSQGQDTAVAGFFNPADLTSTGNNADIVYIDTSPIMYSLDGVQRDLEEAIQTVAHEYQHLIFANYNGTDATFVNEGLSTWAEIMNGFKAFPVNYLGSVSEQERPLLNWRNLEASDYQRAQLFTTYLSERIGVLNTGRITRSTGINQGNYVKVFQDLGLSDDFLTEVIASFHAANTVNDLEVAPSYGYFLDQYSQVSAAMAQTIDGESVASSSSSGSLNPGAVRYIRWNHVGNFSINVIAGQNTPTEQNRLRPLLYTKPPSGPGRVQEVTWNTEVGLEVEGNFEFVTLILPNTDLSVWAPNSPSDPSKQAFSVSAMWKAFDSGLQYETVAYDDGIANNDGNNSYYGLAINGDACDVCLPTSDRFANRFTIPEGGILSSVSVGVFYMSHFGESSSSVRDFELSIWDDDDGYPGTPVLTLNEMDFSSHDPPAISFYHVDLTPYQSQLAGLSGTLYVSVGNLGTDDNYIFIPDVDTQETELPSYLYHTFADGSGWASYQNIRDSNGQPVFVGLAVPIRATFVTGTASEDGYDQVLPQHVELQQNYPNPFNPSTTIRYSVPVSGNVRVAVYDMLGRRVAELGNNFVSAGTHEIQFDASKLSSGMYVYTLETDTERTSKTMMLIK